MKLMHRFPELAPETRPQDPLGPSEQIREAERQRVVEEYVTDLREILKKLRRFFS